MFVACNFREQALQIVSCVRVAANFRSYCAVVNCTRTVEDEGTASGSC